MKRRRAVEHVRESFGRERVSQRRACRVLVQPRSTQRRVRQVRVDEPPLVKRIVQLVGDYGRYCYRRIMALLHGEGWLVNHKRIERLWRQEGLKDSQSCGNYCWPTVRACGCDRPIAITYGATTSCWIARARVSVSDADADRRIHTRMPGNRRMARRLTSEDVLERISDLFVHRGVPQYLRSDNGSEFTANKVREWLAALASRHYSSSQAARRRTVMSRASTVSCATSCWRVSSSTLCWKRRCSSSAAGASTTPAVPTARWDTGPRRPRRSSLLRSLRLRLSERSRLALRQPQL